MATKEEVLEMVDSALFVLLGVGKPSCRLYFEVEKRLVTEKAADIADSGLLVEFGRSPGTRNVLYVEGGY